MTEGSEQTVTQANASAKQMQIKAAHLSHLGLELVGAVRPRRGAATQTERRDSVPPERWEELPEPHLPVSR